MLTCIGDYRLRIERGTRLDDHKRLADLAESIVGHTDALFFALIKGTGVSEGLTPESVAEIREQLETIREEFRQVERALGSR